MLPKVLLKALNSFSHAPELTASLNFELPQGDSPEWIELIPSDAEVIGRDGRRWINDRPQDVVAAFNKDGRDIVIDIEHSTELKAPKGDPAPAAGWIRALDLRGTSVWGQVAWNTAGRQAVGEREYRYYSPVFLYEKAGGRIVQLLSVGLTNRPNLRFAALNHNQSHQEETMWKRLLKALGLADDATEDQALNAVTKMQGDLATALNRAETPSLDKFVPRGDYDVAINRATAAETALTERKKADLDEAITREVDAALKAGKITPGTRDYYTAMCRQENGLAEFKKFVAAAPVVGDPSGLDGKDPDKGKGAALNAEQRQIADMFGNSAEDIAKYGK